MAPMTAEGEPLPHTRMGVAFMTRKTGDLRGPSLEIDTMAELAIRCIPIQFRLDVGTMGARRGGPIISVGKTLMAIFTTHIGNPAQIITPMTELALRHVPVVDRPHHKTMPPTPSRDTQCRRLMPDIALMAILATLQSLRDAGDLIETRPMTNLALVNIGQGRRTVIQTHIPILLVGICHVTGLTIGPLRHPRCGLEIDPVTTLCGTGGAGILRHVVGMIVCGIPPPLLMGIGRMALITRGIAPVSPLIVFPMTELA